MPDPSPSHHPPQEQDRQPGRQHAMRPAPRAEMRDYRGAGRCAGKAVLVSGGDSGIGRAVAIGCAKEGADVAIMYLEEHEDTEATRALIEQEGRRWSVTQIVDDPAGDHEWAVVADVDLDASDEAGGPALAGVRLLRR